MPGRPRPPPHPTPKGTPTGTWRPGGQGPHRLDPNSLRESLQRLRFCTRPAAKAWHLTSDPTTQGARIRNFRLKGTATNAVTCSCLRYQYVWDCLGTRGFYSESFFAACIHSWCLKLLLVSKRNVEVLCVCVCVLEEFQDFTGPYRHFRDTHSLLIVLVLKRIELCGMRSSSCRSTNTRLGSGNVAQGFWVLK